jgi:protein phosphatase
VNSVPRPDSDGATDRGLVRERNEDQFLIAELSKSMLVHHTSLAIEDSTRLSGRRHGYLFLVADGLGGAPEGARASRMAVDQVIRSVLGTMPWLFQLDEHEEDLEGELKKVFEKCQLQIKADARENPSHEGMGTTLTIAYVLWPRLYVVHAGDARCSLFRSGRLEQITEDHTLQAPVRGGGPGRTRKVLWNVIGGSSEEVWPAVYRETLEAGDVLLLATDGLSLELSPERIATILAGARSAHEATEELLRSAKEAGGRDNVTAVVARFGERPGGTPEVGTARAEANLSESGVLPAAVSEPTSNARNGSGTPAISTE